MYRIKGKLENPRCYLQAPLPKPTFIHCLPNGKERRRPLQQLGAEGFRKRQYDQIIAVGQQEEV